MLSASCSVQGPSMPMVRTSHISNQGHEYDVDRSCYSAMLKVTTVCPHLCARASVGRGSRKTQMSRQELSVLLYIAAMEWPTAHESGGLSRQVAFNLLQQPSTTVNLYFLTVMVHDVNVDMAKVAPFRVVANVVWDYYCYSSTMSRKSFHLCKYTSIPQIMLLISK